MQNTRLNTLIDRLVKQFTSWAQNPWRRISLIIICLLLGNFLASAIVTTTGQWAELDITVSLVMVAIVELISWLRYSKIGRSESGQRSLWIVMLDSLKLGVVYGLFLEAFKLGS
jgi:membrane protease YdiL (CAAX protease family)